MKMSRTLCHFDTENLPNVLFVFWVLSVNFEMISTQQSNGELLVCITNCDPGLADINVDVLWLPNLVPRVLDGSGPGHRQGSLEVCEDVYVAHTHVACITTTKSFHSLSQIPHLCCILALHRGVVVFHLVLLQSVELIQMEENHFKDKSGVTTLRQAVSSYKLAPEGELSCSRIVLNHVK